MVWVRVWVVWGGRPTRSHVQGDAHGPLHLFLGGTSAVADLDYLPDLDKIKAPTRIIAAGDDPVTPIVRAEEIRGRIAGSQLMVIDGQRHFSNVEVPAAFNTILRCGLDEMQKEAS